MRQLTCGGAADASMAVARQLRQELFKLSLFLAGSSLSRASPQAHWHATMPFNSWRALTVEGREKVARQLSVKVKVSA